MLAALVAFGHFLGFFALASALSLQLGLLSENLSVDSASDSRISTCSRVSKLS